MTSPRAARAKLPPFLTGKKGELFFSYLQIILGCLIGAAAYPLFMTENRIAPGGLTGCLALHILEASLSALNNMKTFEETKVSLALE